MTYRCENIGSPPIPERPCSIDMHGVKRDHEESTGAYRNSLPGMIDFKIFCRQSSREAKFKEAKFTGGEVSDYRP